MTNTSQAQLKPRLSRLESKRCLGSFKRCSSLSTVITNKSKSSLNWLETGPSQRPNMPQSTHLWPGRCSALPRPRWWCHRCTRRSPLGSELWRGSWCRRAGRWTVRRWGGGSPASTRIAGGGPGELAAGGRWGWTPGREPDGSLWTPAPRWEGLFERHRKHEANQLSTSLQTVKDYKIPNQSRLREKWIWIPYYIKSGVCHGICGVCVSKNDLWSTDSQRAH